MKPQITKSFLTTFVVLVVIYVSVLALVWKTFDSQRDHAHKPTAGAAGGEGEDQEGQGQGGHVGGVDAASFALDGDEVFGEGETGLPPLGDLTYDEERQLERGGQIEGRSRNRNRLGFADKLEAAMSRPLPQKHRAPPRPSMDITEQIAIDDDQRSPPASSTSQPSPSPSLSQQPRRRFRRNRQPSAAAADQPSVDSHMDEVIRDMNSKSGISRMAAPETKVVYPNEDATYGAEPTAPEPSANSIMLSAEQRIMLAHRASVSG